MVTREAWLTQFLNAHFAGFGNWLLALFHQTASDLKQPWADFIVMQVLVALLLILLFAIIRSRLSVDKPGPVQQVFEIIHDVIDSEAENQVGHDGHRHVLLFETLFLFILASNLLGTIPGFVSPTQVIYVPVGCAILAFVYYNIVGIRKQGLGKYLAHFMGPVWWLSWLMVPIEIVSHLARALSLSVRLFANMYAGEQVTLVFLSLTYLVLPALFMGLHVFVSLLQAGLFVLLMMLYVSGAVAEEH